MVIDGVEVCDAKLALFIVDKYDLYQINDVEITAQLLGCVVRLDNGDVLKPGPELRERIGCLFGVERARQAAGVPPKGTPEWLTFWKR